MAHFNIRKVLRATRWFSRLYYGLHVDDLLVEFGKDGFDEQVIKAFEIYLTDEDRNLQATLKKDMKRCYHQIKANPLEYFLFGLRNLSNDERSEFISEKFMYMTMGRLIPRKKHDLEIEDKMYFYTLAKKYFKRQCVGVNGPEDYSKFEEMVLSAHDVILKPNNSSRGKGIESRIINNKEEAKAAFDWMMVSEDHWIVEERIHQCKDMAAWNESSCNTVRFMSFLNKQGFNFITPCFRTGRKGSVVDNGDCGGVFANVDTKTGRLVTDGMDETGKMYEKHPDSGITYRGWQIPRYDELVKTVESIHREIMPSHPYIGWDMALTDEGWVLIECNWGQVANQYIDHQGRRKEFLKYVYGE